MDPAARDRDRRAPRCVRAADGGGHLRHRPVDLHLLDGLLQPRQAGLGPTRRSPRAVRRGDARRGPVRPADRAVHLLGTDLGHVVPADRQRRHQSPRPSGGDAGDLHHRCGRTRAPRRPDHHRPGRRHLPDVRAARRPAERRCGQRRDHPRADRSVHEVGADPVQQLAPGGHGRPHPGECLPALGDDGQGRRLPRGPHGTDVRDDRQLAARGDGDRCADDGDRRAACAATDAISSCSSRTAPSASSAS